MYNFTLNEIWNPTRDLLLVDIQEDEKSRIMPAVHYIESHFTWKVILKKGCILSICWREGINRDRGLVGKNSKIGVIETFLSAFSSSIFGAVKHDYGEDYKDSALCKTVYYYLGSQEKVKTPNSLELAKAIAKSKEILKKYD